MSIVLHKSKQFLAPLIKIIVIIICIYFLYLQWTERPIQLHRLLFNLKNLPWFTFPLMICISISSWLVESKKWKYLINDFFKLRFRESVVQNLTAQAASFITPLRTGEFALKPLFFKKELRKKVIGRVLISNACQMAVTIILGILGVFMYVKNDLHVESNHLIIGSTIAILLAITFILITTNVIGNWNKSKIDFTIWTTTIWYSLLRYIIFASNWIVILWLLDVDFSFTIALRNITLFYLTVSIIPIFQFFDITIKWSIASIIFEEHIFDSEQIIIATTLIWITNSIVPTLLGCVLLPFQKLKTVAN